jgi:hypothetical protein
MVWAGRFEHVESKHCMHRWRGVMVSDQQRKQCGQKDLTVTVALFSRPLFEQCDYPCLSQQRLHVYRYNQRQPEVRSALYDSTSRIFTIGIALSVSTLSEMPVSSTEQTEPKAPLVRGYFRQVTSTRNPETSRVLGKVSADFGAAFSNRASLLMPKSSRMAQASKSIGPSSALTPPILIKRLVARSRFANFFSRCQVVGNFLLLT